MATGGAAGVATKERGFALLPPPPPPPLPLLLLPLLLPLPKSLDNEEAPVRFAVLSAVAHAVLQPLLWLLLLLLPLLLLLLLLPAPVTRVMLLSRGAPALGASCLATTCGAVAADVAGAGTGVGAMPFSSRVSCSSLAAQSHASR